MRRPNITAHVAATLRRVGNTMTSRFASIAAVTCVIALSGLGVVSAMAAPHTRAAKSGRIAIFLTAHGSGKSYDIVTGALADYGTDHDAGHNAQKVVLSKGTFVLAAGDFNKNFKTHVDKATCAVLGSSHAANLAISHGTGAYAAITGSVSIRGTFVEITRKSSTGTCELNKPPLSGSDVITGSGTVSY